MRTPWWSQRFPQLGKGVFDVPWATQAMVQQVLEDGDKNVTVYDNSLKGVLKGATFEEVVAKFKAYGLWPIFTNPMWRGDTFQKYLLVNDYTCVGLYLNDGDLEGRIVTTDRILFEQAQKILEDHIGPRASAGRAYVMVTTQEGPALESIGSAAVPLERGNYNPDVLDDFDHVVEDLKSQSPTGRLAVLDGNPGTGKTFMIRGLLAACPDALFVFVPVALVQELASPAMIGSLLDTKRNKGDSATVFVVEDADNCLGRREEGNVNAVSALLNLGDGIIGSLLDIRLVCTTNLKDEELDAAVVRPGRLSRKIHVGPLTGPVAEDLYERLTQKKIRIREPMTLAEVYTKAKDAGWKPPLKPRRRVGFAPPEEPEYSPSEVSELKDDGILAELLEDLEKNSD
jgi:hypothetical protein